MVNNQYPWNLPTGGEEKPPRPLDEAGFVPGPQAEKAQADGREQFKKYVVGVFAVIGLVALLTLGAWGTVQVVRNAGNFTAAVANFSARFFGANEEITVELASGNVTSGNVAEISWEHKGRQGEGSYAFRYECRDGLVFETDTNGPRESVTCNTSFPIHASGAMIEVTPISTQNRFLDVPFYITYTKEGESEVHIEGKALLTVVNEDITDSRGGMEESGDDSNGSDSSADGTTGGEVSGSARGTGTASGGSQTIVIPGTGGDTGAVRVSDPNGVTDLSVRILATGTIDKTTGAFTEKSEIDRTAGERGGVRFEVVNLGTKESGPWSFIVDLPTLPFFVYRPEAQPSLFPGERVEYTLGFDRVHDKDTGTIVVNIDAARELLEVTRDNNTASATINIKRQP